MKKSRLGGAGYDMEWQRQRVALGKAGPVGRRQGQRVGVDHIGRPADNTPEGIALRERWKLQMEVNRQRRAVIDAALAWFEHHVSGFQLKPDTYDLWHSLRALRLARAALETHGQQEIVKAALKRKADRSLHGRRQKAANRLQSGAPGPRPEVQP